MKKRITIISVIAALIIIFLIVLFPFKEKKVEPIRTTGIVQGKEVNLTSKISGRISELCCREGDTVNAGSVAVRLENDDLKAAVEQAIATLEKVKADAKSTEALVESSMAELNTAEADARSAEAEMEKARVQMQEAERQMQRITSLFKEALVSKADEDKAVTAFESLSATHEASKAGYKAMLSHKEMAKARLNYSLNQLISAKARVKESEANLSFQKARLNDTVIATPISGTIVFKALEIGEFVSPGITIFTIVDLDNLWVRVDVEETLVGKLGLESEALIAVDAMPEKIIKGKVSEISRYAEFATQRDVKHGRQDIKTFHVKINIEDPERILKPGMTVNVEIPRKK